MILADKLKGAGGGGFDVSYTDTYVNTTASTSHSFTADIGAPRGGRYVLITIAVRGAASPSVTINGSAATLLYSIITQVNQSRMFYYIAQVASGTTTSVAMSFATGCAVSCAVYRITGLKSTTPVGTAGQAVTTYNPTDTGALGVVATEGAAIFAAFINGSSLTENYHAHGHGIAETAGTKYVTWLCSTSSGALSGAVSQDQNDFLGLYSSNNYGGVSAIALR